MRGFELVASVIAAFFVVGVGVGVLLVIALPALRRRRDTQSISWDSQYRRWIGRPPGYGDSDRAGWEEPPGAGWEEPPGAGWEEPPGPEDDTQPRWPGGTSA